MSEYLYIGPPLDGGFDPDDRRARRPPPSATTSSSASATSGPTSNPLEAVDPARRHRGRRDRPDERRARSGAAADRRRSRCNGASRRGCTGPPSRRSSASIASGWQSLQSASPRGHRDGASRAARCIARWRAGSVSGRDFAGSIDAQVSGSPRRPAGAARTLEPRRAAGAVSRPGRRRRRQASKLGAGVYLRTDFWAQHHVRRQLRPHLLRREGAGGRHRTVRLPAAAALRAARRPRRAAGGDGSAADHSSTKTAMVTASDHYYPIVKTACQVLRPAYIYERLCLGNWVGGAAQPRAADSLHRRIQRLRDLDAAQLQQHGAVSTRTST